MYDFSRCKLCEEHMAEPKFRLKKTTVLECGSCGFHFIDYLDMMPDSGRGAGSATLDTRAWNFIEGKLAANGKQHRKNVHLVRQHCVLEGEVCLDIGAGAGLFASLLVEEGASATGIEPQAIFREFAEKRFGVVLHGETIDHSYWQQEMGGYFGVVTLWDVLEHVNYPAETLADAYSVMKAGGWLFLDTPCRDSLFYRLSEWSYRLSGGSNPMLLESLYSCQPFRHKQIFTRNQLVQLVERIGWTVVSIQTSPFTVQNKIIMACRKQAS